MFDAEFIFTLILHLFSFWFFIYSILQCIITEFVSIKTFRWVFLSSFSPKSLYFFSLLAGKNMDVVSTRVSIHPVCISGCQFDKYTESKTSAIISKSYLLSFQHKFLYLKSCKGISPKKKGKKRGLSFKNNTWLNCQR